MTNQLPKNDEPKIPWKIVGQIILVIIAITLIFVFGWRVKSVSLLGIEIEPPPTSAGQDVNTAIPNNTVIASVPAIATQTTTPTESLSIGNLIVNENFDSGKSDGFSSLSGNWGVIDDGTGKNMVLETKNGTADKWSHIEFGPSDFSNGTIEYNVRLINYNTSSQSGGKTSLQWRAKQWGDASYALDIQPYFGHFTLDYQGAYPSGEWVSLGEVNLFPKLGVWYLIKLEIQGDKMTVYIDNDLKISANDSRLTTPGHLAFNVDSEAQVQFDNVKVWEVGK